MSALQGKSRTRSANVFINYRREDSAGHAGRLFDGLSDHFAGRLFMDVDTLEPGVDFVEAIEQAVGSCEALIVVIGRQWLDITDKAGRRRLDDPADFVRLELESALARKIRVIPVLVQDAAMPRTEELPPSLAKLARRNAIELSDARWAYDVDRLAQTIQEVLAQDGILSRPPAASRDSAPLPPAVVEQLPTPARASRAWLVSLAALFLVAAVGLVSLAWLRWSPSVKQDLTSAQPSQTVVAKGGSLGASTSDHPATEPVTSPAAAVSHGNSGPAVLGNGNGASTSASSGNGGSATAGNGNGGATTVSGGSSTPTGTSASGASTAVNNGSGASTPESDGNGAATGVGQESSAGTGGPREVDQAVDTVRGGIQIVRDFEALTGNRRDRGRSMQTNGTPPVSAGAPLGSKVEEAPATPNVRASTPATLIQPQSTPVTVESVRPARATILSPRNGDKVGDEVMVQGVVSGLGNGQVFLGIRQGNGRIYPRGELFPNAEGIWSIRLRSSKEKTFAIMVVASTSAEASQLLRDQRSRDDGIAVLPDGASISGAVVTLKKQGRIGGLLNPKDAEGNR